MQPEGNAIVWCEGAFGTTYGKTAHGLVRRTSRYDVGAVIDSRRAGRDAGDLLDDRDSGIPIVDSLETALETMRSAGLPATHFVIGLAPDGGRLAPAGRLEVRRALEHGLHVDAGLHDFLSEDAELAGLAAKAGVRIRDIRRPPERSELHSFTGDIEQVAATRIAVLGTDSALGKRTTAWILVDALLAARRSCELIGTGQTAWLQGAEFSIVLDSLVNDFVSGEIEHAICRAWQEKRPDFLVIEGQGSLMNPAYPGGFEILAAGRPHGVVLQHAPARREYDGFPGYPIHPVPDQIRAIELISGKPVIAIAVNHEEMTAPETDAACRRLEEETGLPAVDPLRHGVRPVVDVILERAAVTGGAS
jgi:uncharacterized NAD-dependent epimerase/dehydratase family protein